MATPSTTLARVGVFTLDGELIGNPLVRLFPTAGGPPPLTLTFDSDLGGHTACGVPPGSYRLVVEADGKGTHDQQVEVTSHGLEEVVVLGRPGLPHYYRGRLRVPFEESTAIAVSLRNPRALSCIEAIATRHDATLTAPEVGDDRIRVLRFLRFGGVPTRMEAAHLIDELERQEDVKRAGLVVLWRRDSLAFLTREFIVKFGPGVTEGAARATLLAAGLEPVRILRWLGTAFLAHASDVWTGLAACDSLVTARVVDYAEPSLCGTSVDDQVYPTDHLFARQWHLVRTGVPAAWGALRSLNPALTPGTTGDRTFGGEDVVIAVFDQGIPTRTVGNVVQVLHPEFDGPVTSGEPKLLDVFDFRTMNRHNDHPVTDHGVKCAGVATALTGNLSAAPGEHEGVVGVAPNCRLISVIRDDNGSELDYADAFLWIAGFDPQSKDEAFPPQITRGADVISCSFGAGGISGVPISGLMADCLDYITTKGRSGQGTVVCMSAGNTRFDIRLERPWAAHKRTIAVSASGPADEDLKISGFGPGVDLCAPGLNIVTSTLPGQGFLPGHTGGSPDYVGSFRGTSAATPLVAGVAALVLSANDSLTASEVRDVLCSTAVRIDLTSTDRDGKWVDTDGDHALDFSNSCGHGRVDAHAAVIKALARRSCPPCAPTLPATASADASRTAAIGVPEPV